MAADDVRVDFLRKAYVSPLTQLKLANGASGGEFDGGVYRSDLSVFDGGLQIKSGYKNRPVEIDPAQGSDAIEEPAVFCGMLQNEHFGHFMVESLARLWAFKQLSERYKLAVFYSRIPGFQVPRFAVDVLDVLGLCAEIRLVKRLTRFDDLAVPTAVVGKENGVLYGHPFVREMFSGAKAGSAGGTDDVYVSRSKLGLGAGGVFLETAIERSLAADGYSIIHPQELSIQDQVDIYRSAKRLIFADGSSFHLYAPFSSKEQMVAVIWRRKVNHLFAWQLNSFSGAKLYGEPCVAALYGTEEDRSRQMVGARSLLDFSALHKQLLGAGFVSSSSWCLPTSDEVDREIAAFAKLRKSPLINFGLTY